MLQLLQDTLVTSQLIHFDMATTLSPKILTFSHTLANRGAEVAFVSTTDGSLYSLGTENPQSPRELCAVIHHGYQEQRSMMSTKVYFLAAAYVTSFVLCIGFGIFQQRAFHSRILSNVLVTADHFHGAMLRGTSQVLEDSICTPPMQISLLWSMAFHLSLVVKTWRRS